MPQRPFNALAVFSRTGLLIATFATTWLGSVAFGRVIFAGGLPGLEGVPLAWDRPLFWLLLVLWFLFTVLLLWVAQGFWTATIGLLHMLRASPMSIVPVRRRAARVLPPSQLPTAAIVMPIYNEDPTRVFAGLEAMIRDVAAQGYTQAFDWFILSDTRDPAVWVREEVHFAALRSVLAGIRTAGTADGKAPPVPRIHYRRRHRNTSRKSGNLENFCHFWGAKYDSMLVLDADSVMSGRTIVEMSQRMAAEPDIGILQAPPTPVGRLSLFARCQQFASRVYGEVFTTGFGVWTHSDGNYYGHNAFLRLEPFMESCGLPILPGKAPLGGEILSHDFVEAALMRKAGYRVVVAYDLGGSYEECPTTLVDFAQRDQRWCQGNMQHVRLVFAAGFHPLSRVHLGMGVMSYLAAPLWMIFMIIGVVAAGVARFAGSDGVVADEVTRQRLITGPITPHLIGIGLFVLVMLMLLIPKGYAVLLLLQRPKLLKAHGGEVATVLSALLEVAVSVLIAPLMMVYHTRFVFSTLAGRTVTWGKQNRDESAASWGRAWRDHRHHMLLGLTATLVVVLVAPALLGWTAPVLVGLVLAVPLCWLLSSARVGTALRDVGLLLIPEEALTPRILRRANVAMRRTQRLSDHLDGEAVAEVDRLVADPTLLRLHTDLLAANPEPLPAPEGVDTEQAAVRAATDGLASLERAEQNALLSDPLLLGRLHRAAWSRWPAKRLAAVTAEPLPAMLERCRRGRRGPLRERRRAA
ncbi:glucans biosynthesis glucosyltransferase MdoH [Phycisphaera mikurensis]|uniref:Glucans biosynthesis glucosyltransferase H n=1 Tax=Phycisphaera mikurensis (strain NBRC 102666 / KCTC 22515 / FYK2301M01) TaxID=1142394 RepID=I0IFX5_PHYMF|nr:glucans biosynthesis glucosyltransferase MdoH [Phycisphaera mikurensis]MBB6440450.1 membrane glycosyltransferase [Phycisphaera mikurensis]BAM04163.1 glucans biosynthesis glucosyltransferase H [Phycisphaera mikurensis NBRC 102666]